MPQAGSLAAVSESIRKLPEATICSPAWSPLVIWIRSTIRQPASTVRGSKTPLPRATKIRYLLPLSIPASAGTVSDGVVTVFALGVGFCLERVVSLLLTAFRQNFWNYSFAREFGQQIDGQEDGAIFQVILYTQAEGELLSWARRRRTQTYTSLTSALGLLLGLLLVVKYYDVRLFSTAGALAVVLAIHGCREVHIHKRTLAAWAEALQRNAVAGGREAVEAAKTQF